MTISFLPICVLTDTISPFWLNQKKKKKIVITLAEIPDSKNIHYECFMIWQSNSSINIYVICKIIQILIAVPSHSSISQNIFQGAKQYMVQEFIIHLLTDYSISSNMV